MTYEEFQNVLLAIRIRALLARNKKLPEKAVFEQTSEGMSLEIFLRMVAGLSAAGFCERVTDTQNQTWLVEVGTWNKQS